MESLAELLEDVLGRGIDIVSIDPVGGGCIHDSRRIRTSDGSYFAKQAPMGERSLLETEAAGLREMAATGTIRVPEVVATGEVGPQYILILEWIDLSPLDSLAGEELGKQLARFHQSGGTDLFGWEMDNYIGSTPQENSPSPSWPDFYCECRLLPQIRLARENGFDLPSVDPLLDSIASLFPSGTLPRPSPLHGDLWGGNAGKSSSGDPILFDPAFYYGDPEADIAFTRFFGGFPETFYRQYRECIPERPGWEIRQTLYNLYHVLNHLNLFGAGYQESANRMIQELNTAVKGGV